MTGIAEVEFPQLSARSRCKVGAVYSDFQRACLGEPAQNFRIFPRVAETADSGRRIQHVEATGQRATIWPSAALGSRACPDVRPSKNRTAEPIKIARQTCPAKSC